MAFVARMKLGSFRMAAHAAVGENAMVLEVMLVGTPERMPSTKGTSPFGAQRKETSTFVFGMEIPGTVKPSQTGLLPSENLAYPCPKTVKLPNMHANERSRKKRFMVLRLRL